MPHAPEYRTRHLSIRLTPSEYARIEAAAHAAAIEISAHVRRLIAGAPIPKRAKHRSIDHVALGRAVAALNHVGSNINQIAKAANVSGNLKAYVMAEQDRALLANTVKSLLLAIENLP